MSLVEIVIVAFNIIIRNAVFVWIDTLGYEQETKRLIRTTKVIFWTQFINTAILLFIVNANMETSPLTFGIIGGNLDDFNRTWFKIIGNTLIGTMVIGIAMPILEAVIEKL